jgi:peroxiredoxin
MELLMAYWLAIIAVELGIVVLSLWAVLYQLMKQQGRILLRQDELERSLGASRNGSANGLDVLGVQRGPGELPIGTPIEPFAFPDLDGRTTTLGDFNGKPMLLVHWNPQCGYCDLVAPDLAELSPELRKRDVQVVLLSHGSAEANRKLAKEHDLEFPILLLGDGKTSPNAFRDQGTPIAYLLDGDGKVASALATGSDKVLALAREAGNHQRKRIHLPGQKSLSQSKIERNGLKAGTLAPPFRLPDVRGGEVALEDFRGRKVFLVFSDPHCGPCEQLAPHLVSLHSRHEGDPALILVGRGEPQENRRKAEDLSFEFPVVVQRKWEISKEYGIFATPVAFLIDEDGVISRDVAKGFEEILALVPATALANAGRE